MVEVEAAGSRLGKPRPTILGSATSSQANPCVPSPMLAIIFSTNFLFGPLESSKD